MNIRNTHLANLPVAETVARSIYLRHIDGLRAIAILLVVGFHAGIPGFSGGFVGVDVFFVISGYLITGLLFRELCVTGRIDILDFYARRARRLLPALAVILAATLMGGTVLLLPFGEQQDLAKSAIAASAFTANIFFWRTQSDYFAGPSDEFPLLHLWTLAVEEQFYIVWPLLMLVVAWLFARRRPNSLAPTLIVVISLLLLVSFLGCFYFTPRRFVMVFYNMPFRAWEFAVGACSFFMASSPFARQGRISQVGASLLAIGGVAAIAVAGMVFDRGTLFPGFNAALPVFGAAAVIMGLALHPTTIVGRMLGSSPMVGIGMLSYSWYLWHWPLLALARADALGETSLTCNVALVGGAFLLSLLTFFFVEEPVRRRRPWPFGNSASSAIAGIVLMVSTAAGASVLWYTAEVRLAADSKLQAAQRAVIEKAGVQAQCGNFRFEFDGLPPHETCTLGSISAGAPLYLLWGDSHAFHFVPAFSAWALRANARVLPRASGACKPYLTTIDARLDEKHREAARNCIAYNKAVLAELPQLKAIGATAVVLAARWSVPSDLQASLGDWVPALKHTIARIHDAGLNVVLMAEVPRPLSRVPQCVARRGADACARPRVDVERERAAATSILTSFARDVPGVRVVDLAAELCGEEVCHVVRDGILTYSDDSHLSVAASTGLASAIGRFLP
ncbi:acyltransferase family protein [Methylocystis sp.]|uniref:acyltransferase family protein n=1 Tax=Methylocystis sp. TaxID=1911079 RepID=UPI003DA28230